MCYALQKTGAHLGADVRQNLLYDRVAIADTKVRITGITGKLKTPQYLLRNIKYLVFNKQKNIRQLYIRVIGYKCITLSRNGEILEPAYIYMMQILSGIVRWIFACDEGA